MLTVKSVAVAVLFGAVGVSSSANADPEYYSNNGSQCRGQAGNPDYTNLFYTTAGVFNTDPVSGGATRQVVCPITWSGFTTDMIGATVTVSYRDGDGASGAAAEVACSLVLTDQLGTGPAPIYKYSCSTHAGGCSSSNPSVPYSSSAGVVDTLVVSPPSFSFQIAGAHLLCQLPPQSRIIGYFLRTPTHNGT